jgi:hypothetical protein
MPLPDFTADQLKHPFFRIIAGYPKTVPAAPVVPAAPKAPEPESTTHPVTIMTTPKGATVTYAGTEHKTPCKLELERMTVEVSISRDGYQTMTRVIEPSEKLVEVKLVKV